MGQLNKSGQLACSEQSIGQSQFNKNECGDRWGLLLMRDADRGNSRKVLAEMWGKG